MVIDPEVYNADDSDLSLSDTEPVKQNGNGVVHMANIQDPSITQI